MKDVQDRIVQYANRYKLTDAGTGTELGTYDFEEVTGTVQQAGTPIDKELFDSIKKDIDDIVDGTMPIANTVRYTAQTLADEQKEQARTNIGALGEDDIKINLNGAEVTSPSFYAPTTSGTAGQVLKSMGAKKPPVWANERIDISNAIVTLGASLTYNGSAQTQTVASVKLGSVTLRAGTDYDISGNVATDAGNYTLIVSGKGDYSGFAFVDWSIAKAQGSISASETSVNIIGAPGTTKQITVNVTSGYGELVATSSAPNIATVSLAGNALTITSVANGNATISVSLIGNYTASASVSVNVTIVSTTLDDNSWDIIKSMADRDIGANIWAVGDTKQITINGTVGTKSMSNYSTWVYIIGFNHNASVEGNHLIHFHGFKTAQTGGTDIGLIDRNYTDSSTSGTKYFSMNHSQGTNSGGWKGCDLRYDILGSTDVNNGDPSATCTSSPVANTLMAALESDLRAVMQPVTKYTDNEGGNTSDASDVTATKDYLWLLAEYEVHGEISYANSAEQNYQQQYAYYANGNSKVKYRDTSPSITSTWWCRSRYDSNGLNFCCVRDSGAGSFIQANNSYAVAPCFAV